MSRQLATSDRAAQRCLLAAALAWTQAAVPARLYASPSEAPEQDAAGDAFERLNHMLDDMLVDPAYAGQLLGSFDPSIEDQRLALAYWESELTARLRDDPGKHAMRDLLERIQALTGEEDATEERGESPDDLSAGPVPEERLPEVGQGAPPEPPPVRASVLPSLPSAVPPNPAAFNPTTFGAWFDGTAASGEEASGRASISWTAAVGLAWQTLAHEFLGVPSPAAFALRRLEAAEALADASTRLLSEELGGAAASAEVFETGRELLANFRALPSPGDPGRWAALRAWQERFSELLPRLPAGAREAEIPEEHAEQIRLWAWSAFEVHGGRAPRELQEALREAAQPGGDEAEYRRQLDRWLDYFLSLPPEERPDAGGDEADFLEELDARYGERLDAHYAAHPALADYYGRRARRREALWRALRDGSVPEGAEFSPEELGLPASAGPVVARSLDGRRGLWTAADDGWLSFSSLDGRLRLAAGPATGDFVLTFHDEAGRTERLIERAGGRLLDGRFSYAEGGLREVRVARYGAGAAPEPLPEAAEALLAFLEEEPEPLDVHVREFDASGRTTAERLLSPDGAPIEEALRREDGTFERWTYGDNGLVLVRADDVVTEMRLPGDWGAGGERRRWHYEIDSDLSGLAGQERLEEAQRRARAAVRALGLEEESAVPLARWLFSAGRDTPTRLVATRRAGEEWTFELHELDAEGRSAGYHRAAFGPADYLAVPGQGPPRVLMVHRRAERPDEVRPLLEEYLPNGERMLYRESVRTRPARLVSRSETVHKVERLRERLEVGPDQWSAAYPELGFELAVRVADWSARNDGTSLIARYGEAVGLRIRSVPLAGDLVEYAGRFGGWLYNGGMGLLYLDPPWEQTDPITAWRELHSAASLARADGLNPDPRDHPEDFGELLLRVRELSGEARGILEARALERRLRLAAREMGERGRWNAGAYAAQGEVTEEELVKTLMGEHGATTWGAELARWSREDAGNAWQPVWLGGSVLMHGGEEVAQILPLIAVLHGAGAAANAPGLSAVARAAARVSQWGLAAPFIASWALEGIPVGLGDFFGGLAEDDPERLSRGLGSSIVSALFFADMAGAFRPSSAQGRAERTAAESRGRAARGGQRPRSPPAARQGPSTAAARPSAAEASARLRKILRSNLTREDPLTENTSRWLDQYGRAIEAGNAELAQRSVRQLRQHALDAGYPPKAVERFFKMAEGDVLKPHLLAIARDVGIEFQADNPLTAFREVKAKEVQVPGL